MMEQKHSACPECGETSLQRLPLVDGDGHLVSCANCGFESVERSAPTPPSAGNEDGESRFRKLLEAAKETPPTSLPESLLEDLPEDARQQLQGQTGSEPATHPKEADPSVPSDLEQRLRQQGYYLHTDHRGAHLSGQGPKPGTGDLSALDVVRLAAELEGGMPASEDRQPCPHCQAVVTGHPDRCPWCGNPLGSTEKD